LFKQGACQSARFAFSFAKTKEKRGNSCGCAAAYVRHVRENSVRDMPQQKQIVGFATYTNQRFLPPINTNERENRKILGLGSVFRNLTGSGTLIAEWIGKSAQANK